MNARRLLFACAATALGLWIAARAFGPIDGALLTATIAGADMQLIPLAVGCMALTIAARTLRASLILGAAGVEAAPSVIREVFLTGWWLNAVLPARAGDAYRIAALRSVAGGGRAMGALVAERAMDLIAVTTIVGIAVVIRFGDQVPLPIAAAVAIAAVIAFAAVIFIFGAGRIGARLPHPVLQRAAAGVALVGRSLRPTAGRSTALTVLGWSGEVARFALVAIAVGSAPYIGAGGIIAAALVAALLSTVPFSPAGLGIAEAGVAVMTTAAGVPGEIAAAAVLIDRLCSTGAVIVGGLPFAARRLMRAAR